MQSPQTVPADLLSALSAALSELRAQWYVFGAQAAVVWGRPRLTADIDVTVRQQPEDLDIELIRSTLGLLEDALAQSDLLPVFERELARRREDTR